MAKDETSRFEPTEADVRNLATAMLAGVCGITYPEAACRVWSMVPGGSDTYESMLFRAAQAAFDHAGYLPSIVAARRDARRQIDAAQEAISLMATALGIQAPGWEIGQHGQVIINPSWVSMVKSLKPQPPSPTAKDALLAALEVIRVQMHLIETLLTGPTEQAS